LVPVWPKN